MAQISPTAPLHRQRLRMPAAILACFVLAGLTAASEPLYADRLKEIPAPKPLAAEKAYLGKLDAALKPLTSRNPSPEEVKRLNAAAKAVHAKDADDFAEARAKIADPLGRKLADWMRLRAGVGDAAEYLSFLKDNPLWPARSLLTHRLEEVMFTDGGSSKTIRDYFAASPPQSGAGYAALASAYLVDGNTGEAKKLAAKVWREMTIPPSMEDGFLNRFGKLLTPADHKWRFDRLVTDDVRWAHNRKERAAAARRMIPLLPETGQKKAKARLAVFSKSSKARALMHDVPRGGGQDTGLAYHRAQVLRRAGKVEEAAHIILSIPPDPKKIVDLDEWWAERRELAYDALKIGKLKLAYELVKDAGPLSVNPRKEQTFMAGWIAFRYLGKPRLAEKHFKDFADAADGPLSQAKAAYWLGRLAAARGNEAEARKQYRLAARNSDTFHGLLAMQMLQPKRTALDIALPKVPSAQQVRKFISLDPVKALVLASKADLSHTYTRSFLIGLKDELTSEAEASMLAHLADVLGDTQMSVRIAKAAVARGENLLIYSYPVTPFPAYKPLRSPPETAVLLAIARQETEFSSGSVSGAGAKGLLQVMSGTARHVCHVYKIKCHISRLRTDKGYNAMIASAYVADRLDDFDGSYLLGLVGYNAGPGRARQWIRENGDPRDPKVDPIDWIERIPNSETRNYVTKVLSNIQVYRARLGGAANALRIREDLSRARPASRRSRDSAFTDADNEDEG